MSSSISAWLIAVVTGFNAGLLRSAVTILAYLVAMPIAVWADVAGVAADRRPARARRWRRIRCCSSAFFWSSAWCSESWRAWRSTKPSGRKPGIGDRLGGAALGAVRVGLVAITLVLIFDQLVPADRQPAFLTGSQLRPLLSAAGQKGFRSLPPDVAATIDRLKRKTSAYHSGRCAARSC